MDSVAHQLLQRVPLVNFDLSGLQEFPSDDIQRQLLNLATESKKTNPHYTKEFVKKLISRWETIQGEDDAILDGYYELVVELLQSKPLSSVDTDILTYTLGPDTVIIKESPNLISGMGTTGLRTWEASLFLSQWLLEQIQENTAVASDFIDKTVLELGCGTGFVGIALHKSGRLQKVILTDGDSQLVDRMAPNLALNKISLDELDVHKLWWGQDAFPPGNIDTIVAADVTYDASVIPDLATALREAMHLDPESTSARVAYIAATVRNTATIQTWEHYLDLGQSDQIWRWQIVSTSTKSMQGHVLGSIYYPVGVGEIRIYKLTNVNAGNPAASTSQKITNP